MSATRLPEGIKEWLKEEGLSLAAMARECGVTRTTVSLIVNHGRWPVYRRKAVAANVLAWLEARGFPKEKTPKRSRASRSGVTPAETINEGDEIMLLKKEPLTQAARQHFGLQRDPFAVCQEPADVFLASPDVRYVREAMWSAVRHGGFMGIVGESGSGKTTLREELLERIGRDAPEVIVAQPYVLAMEETDTVGRTLRSHHIAECLLHAIAPLARPRSSPDARFRQLHDALKESARSGMRHVLMIEEAHCLPIPTLKHLKRYMELKDGMRALLSILLIGQPELAIKLDERNPQVREVAQRIELVTLPPLDQHLGEYLRHRFQRIGADIDQVLDPTGRDALQARLTPGQRQGRNTSLLYPLAVHNLLARCMNAAAELGAPKVTRDIVTGGAQ